jgi:chromosome partitioning protein
MVISVLNQKGGVGKTTIALNLCHGIAVKRFSVLLIDADPQGSVMDWQGIAGSGSFNVIHYTQDDLYKEISSLGKGYDHVIIDGPPGKESVTKSILTISDLVIIPVRPSILDLWSSREIVDLVTQAKELRPLEGRLLVSQKAPGTRLGKEAHDSLKGLGLPVMETEISNRIAYAEAMLAGLPVMVYDGESEASREIKNLTREVLKGAR